MVLFIIVLVLGSILVPLGTQVEQRQVNDTQRMLEDIKEALIGFAVANGYLPCPDKNLGVGGAGTANDGIEDVNAGACVATSEGNLPWVTLGLGASDVWGNRFRYQVTAAFAQRAPLASFGLSTAATINVCNSSGCPTAASRLTAASPDGAVAIVISLGKNGYSAFNAATGTANPAPASADENDNVAGPSFFVSRDRSPEDSAAGEFDDIVTWVSKFVLLQRMVVAGKLP